MRINAKFVAIAACGVALILLLSNAVYERAVYPFGRRSAFIHSVYGSLRNYAVEHDGAFPDANNQFGLDALQKLYPNYCTSPKVLAGLSGSIDAVTAAISKNKQFADSESSWRYVPRKHLTNDASTLLLWERHPGVTYNGKVVRDKGHTVLFVDGRFEFIAETKWTSFLAKQGIEVNGNQ
jgi:hypothetical protein